MSRRKKSFWFSMVSTLLILVFTVGICWKWGGIPVSWETFSTGELLTQSGSSTMHMQSDENLNVDPIVFNSDNTSDDFGASDVYRQQPHSLPAPHGKLTRISPPPLLPVPNSQQESFIPENHIASSQQNPNQTLHRTAEDVRPISGDSPRSSHLQPPSIPATSPQMSANQTVSRERLSSEIRSRLQQIDAALAKPDDLTALRLLSELYWNKPQARPLIQQKIQTTAERVFFSPRPHYLDPYVIQGGDQLSKVAKKYQISWQYLARLNQINPRRLRQGQRLKVIQGPFAAVVSLKAYEITVHLKGYYVKTYRVGLGKNNSTPTGKFKVLNKVVNPQYTDPDGRVIAGDDPSNPLGERWLDLGNSYGIHGTIEPESIGQSQSRGCVRLLNEDVEELYDLLTVGSEVVIQP